MKNTISDKDLGMSKITHNFKDIKGSFVKVGLQGSKGEAIHKDSKLSIVEIGAVHEFGSDKDGKVLSPERSFLRSTYDENWMKWKDMNKTLIQNILLAKMPPKIALKVMGLRIVADIKSKILKRIAPANKPKTVKAKGSDLPLVDKGQMINAITFVEGKK